MLDRPTSAAGRDNYARLLPDFSAPSLSSSRWCLLIRPGISLLAWLLLVTLAGSRHSHAGTGSEASLPAIGIKNKSGLRLSISGRGIDGNGYRPIHIDVTPWPVKPLTADR